MLSVLIVDDEEKIGKLLRHIIDWNSIGLNILDIVSSGRRALEIIEQETPDILITDIKMPEFNGIQLVEMIHRISPHTRCIVISGYRKFEYAKRVMQFDVADYLLKPIKKSELLEVLNKIIRERNAIDEKNKYVDGLEQDLELLRKEKRALFFQEFTSGTLSAETCTPDWLSQELGIHFPYGSYHVFCICVDLKKPAPEDFSLAELLRKNVLLTVSRHFKKPDCQLLSIPCPRELVCILNFRDSCQQTIIQELYHIIYDIKNISDSRLSLAVTIGMSAGPCQEPRFLPQALASARKAAAHRLIAGIDQVITLSENDLPEKDFQLPSSFCEQIYDAMREKNRPKMDSLYSVWKGKVQSREFSHGHEYLLAAQNWIHILFCDFVMLHLGSAAQLLKREYEDKLAGCYTKQMLFSCMEQLHGTLLSKLLEADRKNDSRPIYLVKQYINENYAKSVTLEDASRQIGFSSPYLSSLFKKETGKNFSEYLSEVRIKNAKKLLKNPDLTSLEIAQAVGYADEKYFFRVFKKYTGLTPKEFKQLYY